MKKQFGIFLGAASIAIALLMSGLSETKAAFTGERTPPLGKECVVQFRRDALGTAASLPVAPLTGSINGAETTVSGKLAMVGSEWIVVTRTNGNDLWIPKTSVLLIQY